jgi:hypothetical protein
VTEVRPADARERAHGAGNEGIAEQESGRLVELGPHCEPATALPVGVLQVVVHEGRVVQELDRDGHRERVLERAADARAGGQREPAA